MLTQDGLPRLLDGFELTTQSDAGLPIKICAEHLSLLGAGWKSEPIDKESGGTGAVSVGQLALRRKRDIAGDSAPTDELECLVGWQRHDRQKAEIAGGEAIIQAVSGLMGVHGRDSLVPRRIGLEVASVASGLVITQGLLAALIANSRGHRIRQVKTSALQAALLFLYHHLAIATCDGEFPFRPLETGQGPPFLTADGHQVELEILNGDAWFEFWERLGVEPLKLAGAGWLPFVYRYLSGRCVLPTALHEATERHTLLELRRVAQACGVVVCRVRTYSEVLTELGWPDGVARKGSDFQPRLRAPWTIYPGEARPDIAPPTPVPGDAPLSGLRVIEVTSRLQGPMAGCLLRMLGADVIKVEPPGGDFGRISPPLAGKQGAAYLAYNRGKQIVEIDYKRPEGRDQIIDLVADADIFLHNWRSGRAEKLGLDFEQLTKCNPRLVYAHASGWGRDNEEPCVIAGDYLVQAYAACGDGLNPRDEPPTPTRLTIIDAIGGLLACEGILAGVYLREQTGRGCRVDTSLLAGSLMLQSHVLKPMAMRQETGRCMGRPLWGILDRPLKTAEGFLMLSIEDERTRKRLSEVCGLASSSNDAMWEREIAERLCSRPAAEWELLFLEAGISAAMVISDLKSLPLDSRFKGLIERVNDACWAPAAPWQFDK
jgi:crotonobetainyl-CoA:carnitine CoA-transferase CaiB-like acyl-CoA transferase